MENQTKRVRYPGAGPFETSQKDIFFGRQNAIEALMRKIRLEPVVVLYGKSGDGKSSLINAGIIPRIELPTDDEAGLDPIKIRFGAYRKESNDKAPIAIAVAQILHPQKTFLHAILPNDISLWRVLKKRQIIENQADKQGCLLIFDQFEELFTYPTEQIDAFGKQLSELLRVLIPTRYIKEIQNIELPDADRKILHTPLNVRCLFSIRTDRLSLLNLLQKHLPNIQKINYELPPLSHEEAEDAILFPALKKGDFDTHSFEYEDAALQQLMKYLTKDGKQDIASFQLQIVCEDIENRVLQQKWTHIKVSDVPNPDKLYENYYRDRILSLPETEQDAVRHLIEDGLVYEEEERRLSLYEGQIKKMYGIADPMLAHLVNERLLRSEPSLQGGYTYELSHDTLVKPVANWKKIRLKENRRKKEQIRRLWLAFWVVLAIIGFVLTCLSAYLYRNLKKEKEKTEASITALSATLKKLEAEKKAHNETQANELVREGHLFFVNKIYHMALTRFEAAYQLTPADTVIQQKMAACRRFLESK
ncbi:MAG: hypothetical protein RL329_1711 [Bacteroidota bacterium]